MNNYIALGTSCRRFRTRVDGCLSDKRRLESGMPQTFVLGPLPFPKFVGDVTSGLQNPCLTFADNIKVVGKTKSKSRHGDPDKVYK